MHGIGETVLAESRQQPRAQRPGEHVGIERAGDRYEAVAPLVELADDHGPAGLGVERVLDEPLERRALLLDDDHLGESAGESADEVGIERDRHPQLQQADAGVGDPARRVESEQPQRLEQLVVGVARGDDPDPCVGGPDADPVQLVVDAVAAGDVESHLLELTLHVERVRREQLAGGSRHEELRRRRAPRGGSA